MNGRARWTVLFSPEDSGTRVTVKVGKAQAPNALTATFLRAATRFQKKKVHQEFITQLELLDAFLADKDNRRINAGEAAWSVSQTEIKNTVRELTVGRGED
jgi:hypothetical protein